MKRKVFFAALSLFLVCAPVWAAAYRVDADHSSVSFKVKHLVSRTQGWFKKFEGTLEYEPGKPESWAASGTLQVASLDTNSAERDKHLLSADFFEADKYPVIEFKSTGVKEASETGAKLEGILKMHGVEQPVTLDVEIGGVAQDPWGNTRAAFTATVKLARKDFGILWNKTLDQGGLLLGEDVDVTLEIEAIKQ